MTSHRAWRARSIPGLQSEESPAANSGRTAEPPPAWLGSAEARQDWVDGMSTALATAFPDGRGPLLPTGVGTPFPTSPGEACTSTRSTA